MCKSITCCGNDSAGRVISVKLDCGGVNLLLLGVTFHVLIIAITTGICWANFWGYIEGVAMRYPGARLCILGDLNFECKPSNEGIHFLNV